MSNPNYTAVLFIIDVSGSMDNRYRTMEQALHLMLEQQARKLAGYLTVDVGYFDDVAYQGIQDADPMTVDLALFANGGTQIYDSSATLISTFQGRLNNLPASQQPGHVVVVFVTDGGSMDANSTAGRNIGNTIQGLRNSGWDFALLAAEGGALKRVQQGLGLPDDCAVFHPFNAKGIQAMADDLGQFVSMSRSGERGHF
jgi:hypothetical protein